MRKFVIGDIHGLHEGLKQVFKESNFDTKKDKLIVLGDVCDGWPFVKQCFDDLLKIDNLIYVLGNHDQWALDWYTGEMGSEPEYLWTQQGGQATLDSYMNADMDNAHIDLLSKALPYYIEDNDLFVHGGMDETATLEEQGLDTLLWDRSMFEKAVMVHPVNPDYKFQDWRTVFIGHTTIQNYSTDMIPLRKCNVVNLDTGAGWSGKLTLMEINTGEFWQSDLAHQIYPNIKGRSG